MTSNTTDTTHAQKVPVTQDETEFYPAHPPRQETSTYAYSHHFMVDVNDMPCEKCGVKKSTLNDPTQNPFGAKDLETHHHIQREFADALDWQKVAKDFPEITSREDFIRWIDSPGNMHIYCDQHHRSKNHGVHHLLVDDFVAQKYLLDGYILDDSAKNAAADIAKDNAIVSAEVPQDERI